MRMHQDYIRDRVVPDPNSGCWLWDQSLRSDGYGNACIAGVVMVAHRLAYKAFRGPVPDNVCVLHSCDTRPCVNPAHLWLGTRSDNNADMDRKGRSRRGLVRGESHGCAKLTASQVLQIRASREPGSLLAARYGIGDAQVSAIRTGRAWKHLPGGRH